MGNLDHLEVGDGVFVDGSEQYGGVQNSNIFINGDNIRSAIVSRLLLKEGSMGVRLTNVKNYILSQNIATKFSGWAFSSGGNLENLIWRDNISTDSEYDGLKMTGQIKNVLNNSKHSRLEARYKRMKTTPKS